MCDTLVEEQEGVAWPVIDLTHQLLFRLTRKEITLESSKHLVGREQQLLGYPGWLRVRLIPL
jgi:hypothetical protein